jgi:hypothetical protein
MVLDLSNEWRLRLCRACSLASISFEASLFQR